MTDKITMYTANIVCLFLLLLLCNACCIFTCPPMATKSWEIQPSPEVPDSFPMKSAGRAQGGLLLASYGKAFLVSDIGTAQPVHSGTERVVVNPGGDTFGVSAEDEFHVYSADGTLLYSLPRQNPSQYFKLIPGSERVLAAIMSSYCDGEGVCSPRGFRVIEADGTASTVISASDLSTSRPSRDFLVYTSADAITKVTYDGVEVWSHPAMLSKLRVPQLPEVDRIIAVPVANSNATRRIVHLTNGIETHSEEVGEAIFELAISPNGVHSAAITRRSVYIFHDAELSEKISLPVYSTASVDVNDHGEVLVGAKDDLGEGTVRMFSANGTEVLDDPSGFDDSGFRPWVEFGPTGESFVVISRQGTAFYEIVR
jgi:hypothetical protein